MGETLRALAALVLLSAIWGYNWVVMKVALNDMGAFQFGAWRTFGGALCVFALMVVLRRPLKLAQLPSIALMGLLQTTGFTGLIILALVTGGAGKTAVLTYTMPFWVMVFAWPMLGERLHGWQWPSAAATLAGLLLILDPLHLGGDLSSMMLATLAGACWALAVMIAKRLQVRAPALDLLSMTAWQMFFGSLPLVAMAFVWPAPPVNWSASLGGALLFNIVLANALAWLLWLYALRRLSAGTSSMVSLLTPVIGVLAAAWQLGERPDGNEVLGMLLIGAGLLLLSAEALRRRRMMQQYSLPAASSGGVRV
ncbi:MAG: DMT family transporter [Gammaproteobacteria bacterium]|jgi:drug/metabolite transporter (DMT)-like permease|nr:DMT family transporter [Gammaproteobacteria bacterium]MBU0770719.1 DMT family transporter [Gammaproteobacteria bacterium]MBU0857593.1 DMT family transporter [Gammaproteobacteria bacterium]MBU1848663.1 DMT family transporter [Gammaproteobacteria bacterium]